MPKRDKNMYGYILNNLIPADDLHWDEEEKRYVSLSKEETEEIILCCISQGIADFDNIVKVVNWYGGLRVGNLLLKNMLSGSIKVVGFDEENEPLFAAKEAEDEN